MAVAASRFRAFLQQLSESSQRVLGIYPCAALDRHADTYRRAMQHLGVLDLMNLYHREEGHSYTYHLTFKLGLTLEFCNCIHDACAGSTHLVA